MEKDNDRYLEKLNLIISNQINKKKKFEIVIKKILFGQLIIDGTDKFTLGSPEVQHNAQQLVLSKKSIDIFGKINNEVEVSSNELDEVYTDICDKINNYFSLYDKRDFRQKLNNAYDIFKKFSIEEKIDILDKILRGLHANADQTSLKELGIKTPLGFFQTKGGIKLSPNAELIYQSPTGLIERRVKLKNL